MQRFDLKAQATITCVKQFGIPMLYKKSFGLNYLL